MANEIISKENELVAIESTNKDYGSIRTISINGETWLCGLDACKVLGYTDITKTIKYHVKKLTGKNSRSVLKPKKRNGLH